MKLKIEINVDDSDWKDDDGLFDKIYSFLVTRVAEYENYFIESNVMNALLKFVKIKDRLPPDQLFEMNSMSDNGDPIKITVEE